MVKALDVAVQVIRVTMMDILHTFLLDPNVVFLLFVVAMLGLYLEISHPGAILPGVIGAIALVLFFLGASSLSPNWTGFVFMVAAFILLVLDLRVPPHGILTIGAMIALIVGATIFFGSVGATHGPKLNLLIVYVMSGVIGLIGLVLVAFVVHALRMHVTTGQEGMIGAEVIALTPLRPEGRVSYGGENWIATLDAPANAVDAGTRLQIVSVDGLRLRVRPVRMRAQAKPPSIASSE